MFSCQTLLPNVQIIRPLPAMDREHLTEQDLDFHGAELPTILIVDLRTTRSMDSEGMAWLVNLQILMTQQKKTLLLVNPSAVVTNILRKAGIENRFLTAANLGLVQEILSQLHPDLFSTRIVPCH